MSSDSTFFVESLKLSLSQHYSNVQILALGAEQDIAFLQDKFDDVISLEDLSFNYSANRIILLSIDAFYELHNHIPKFKEITLWFDPEFNSSSDQLEFLSSVTTTNFANTAQGAICARSQEGQDSWNRNTSIDTPNVTPIFDISLINKVDEPIIERKGIPRFLIDGSSNLTNYALVDSFITLQETEIDVEVWCFFSGQLKAWMRPDFKIDSLPIEEMGMYINAVDGVILAGEDHNDAVIANYISLGKLPIVLDKNSEKRIESFIDTEKVKLEFPTFGTAELALEFLKNPELLDKYNGLLSEVASNDMFFSYSHIEKYQVDTKELDSFLVSTQYDFSRQEYNKAKYNDPCGSSFHKKILQNSQIVAKYDSVLVTEGRITGWALNANDMTVARPKVLSKTTSHSCLLRRYNRADVIEHFNLRQIDNVGFAGKFVLLDESPLPEDMLYAVEVSATQSVIINTMLDDLDTNYSEEEFNATGEILVENEDVKGCIETLTFVDAASFALNDMVGDINQCEFRIQFKDDYILGSQIDVFVLVDNKLTQLSTKQNDEFSYSLDYLSDISSPVNVIVSSELHDLSELSCIVSTTQVNIGLSGAASARIEAESSYSESLIDSQINEDIDDLDPIKLAS